MAPDNGGHALVIEGEEAIPERMHHGRVFARAD
jgi:hypothetical protein